MISSFVLISQLFFITNQCNVPTLAFTIPSSSTSSLLSSTYSTTSTKLQMSLEPLAKEGSWTAYLDEENTGLIYYFNTDTGESSWDPPTSTFPKVKISRWKEAKMASKRKEYNDNVAVDDADNDNDNNNDTSNGSGNIGGGGMFNFFGKNDDQSAKVVDEIVEIEEVANNAKEGTPIFKIFGSNVPATKTTDDNEIEESAAEATNNDATPGFFNFFGQQQSTTDEINDETTEPNGINGSSSQPPQTNNFFGNFFGQSPTVKRSENNNAVFSVEINGESNNNDVEEDDDFYDQMMFEDAVLVEEEPEIQTPIKLEIASKIMPHPEKISWGGEDALFVSGKSFGVFDGVSGAEKLDGVPLYSNTLAQQLKSSVGKSGLTIDEIKEKMLKAAEYADMAATGASTAVVASIGDDDMLRVVNLGDSQLYVVRDGSIKARAKETIHYFDCPFQLSDESPDRPRNGSVLQTPIQKGDLIIAGSDGVFDNLGDPQLLELVESNSKKSISKLAQQIVSESRKVSKDPNAATPYAKLAKRNNYAGFSKGVGGKLDDISCVVVRCK